MALDLEPPGRRPAPRVTHVALARWVIPALATRGLDATQTCQLARVHCSWTERDTQKLTQPGDAYVHSRDCFALWEVAFALLERVPRGARPELLTLILRDIESAGLEVWGFHVATAPTLRAACDAFMAGVPLLSTCGAWSCLESAGKVTFRLEHTAGSRCARVFNQALLLLFLRTLTEISDTGLVPLRVGLAHERSIDDLAFERAVRTRVDYTTDVNRVTFAAAQLERAPRFEHAAMHRHFCDRVARTLDALNLDADMVEALRRQLRDEDVLTRECLVAASARLGVSPRTLQRRLQKAGTSFSDELARVRRERAHQLVAHGRRPLAAVARELGFADQAAFSRAFRRWFAASPNSVRSVNRHEPPSFAGGGDLDAAQKLGEGRFFFSAPSFSCDRRPG